MRAAEHQRIDAVVEQRLQVLHQHFVGDVTIEPAFFDQRDEEGTRPRGQLHIRIQGAQSLFVRAALDRGAGADHSNVLVARGGDRGGGPGSNHPRDR